MKGQIDWVKVIDGLPVVKSLGMSDEVLLTCQKSDGACFVTAGSYVTPKGKTARGSEPRWVWHSMRSPWPVLAWAYMPEPAEALAPAEQAAAGPDLFGMVRAVVRPLESVPAWQADDWVTVNVFIAGADRAQFAQTSLMGHVMRWSDFRSLEDLLRAERDRVRGLSILVGLWGHCKATGEVSSVTIH